MKIVLSGGGTGGHIYPALALREYILTQYPDAEFLYIGTEKGLENTIVPKYNIPFETIKVQGIRRSLSLENIKTAVYAVSSIFTAKKILKKFNPDIVIGTGGYVCGPVLYAASKLGIPTIIHEQNSVAGVTNKILAKYVTKICTCFETVNRDFEKYTSKIVMTGNPRAQELLQANVDENALEGFGLQKNKPTVLFFGGSRGAMNLNAHVVSYYKLYTQMNTQFIFVTGQAHYNEIASQISDTKQFKVVPYINNMIDVLHAVDLVVCRSGATTLAELTALGVPSVLVPSPFVTNNHQEKNARSLVDKQAAEIVLEDELPSEKLYHYVYDLMHNREQLEKMSKAAQKMGITDASKRILNVIREILR
ncbi:undecaprenyldiphospho-muramoylpentapeptide beta-N-acetylglucosaminyltransferase [Carnobacteriaceae bacterium zg-ZUI252]|nr:undecaprenyldiphospho-muramoylpentapeptide beta-N-acetylglucosaminyltransferase [Carnobacteriaceae bacterium zg-ZUI252]MBS4769785.1 undecaprenyldiphospho-muramoylpentapeptide beta-N-acetylglucosaminyltransferase [Carnobacteriaceae bacterium zg-ZUI240]QTU82697.1 undecaprenyldiphospho-muramoylpentapeptide beta-N-acetylglucosaminyltransferase [Carnobacteriaceae bacterium zg-C25]